MKDNNFKYLINKNTLRMTISYIIILLVIFIGFKFGMIDIPVLKDNLILKNLNEIILSAIISAILVSFLFIFLPIFCSRRYISEETDEFNVLGIYTYSKNNNDKGKLLERIYSNRLKEKTTIVSRMLLNKSIKNKKIMLFLSDNLKLEKIDYIFELSNYLSSLGKKVLIIDIPLDYDKELERYNKEEEREEKRKSILKLTSFSDKLALQLESKNEEVNTETYSALDKNVKYIKFGQDNNIELISSLLRSNFGKVIGIEEEIINKYDYVLINGVDKIDEARYLPLMNLTDNIILLNRLMDTNKRRVRALRKDIEKADKNLGLILIKDIRFS